MARGARSNGVDPGGDELVEVAPGRATVDPLPERWTTASAVEHAGFSRPASGRPSARTPILDQTSALPGSGSSLGRPERSAAQSTPDRGTANTPGRTMCFAEIGGTMPSTRLGLSAYAAER
jgi:hypothetical protein